MEKTLKMNCNDAIDYIKENVKIYDEIELSYHRIFTPGEVLNIEEYDCNNERKSCRVLIQIKGENIGQTVDVDLEEIKKDLVEIKHLPKGEKDITTIVIENCETDMD